MSFNLKTYKFFKIKDYFKKVNFFFFFHGISLNTIKWIKVEQLLKKDKLKSFQILNSLMVKVAKNSIFKNLTTLIHGPILLIHINSDELTAKKLNSISMLINLLCLKLNNKIYSKKQIKNLKKLSYSENIYLFYNSLQIIIKIPYFRFKNQKII